MKAAKTERDGSDTLYQGRGGGAHDTIPCRILKHFHFGKSKEEEMEVAAITQWNPEPAPTIHPEYLYPLSLLPPCTQRHNFIGKWTECDFSLHTYSQPPTPVAGK